MAHGPAAGTPAQAAVGFDRSLTGAAKRLAYDCTSGAVEFTSSTFVRPGKMHVGVVRNADSWVVTVTYRDARNTRAISYDVRAAAHGGYCVASFHGLPQPPRTSLRPSTGTATPSASRS